MASLESMSCPSCGGSDLKKIDDDIYLCNHCGTRSILDEQKELKVQPEITLQEAPRRGVPLWAQVIVWVALVGMLVVLALGLKITQQGSVQVGDTINDFNLKFFDGYNYQNQNNISLTSLKGKVVVINFWASWCKPCEQEAADMQASWKFYEPTGKVVFLGVDYVDTEPEARSYLTKFGISYPNGPDLETHISQMFRIKGVPETYIVDQSGKLVQTQIGPFDSEAQIHALIDPLLK